MLHPQVVDRQDGVWSWRVIENKLNKQSTGRYFLAWGLDTGLKIPYSIKLLATKYVKVAVTLGTEKFYISFYENCLTWTKAGKRLPDNI
jgi:hypothetical protein